MQAEAWMKYLFKGYKIELLKGPQDVAGDEDLAIVEECDEGYIENRLKKVFMEREERGF